MTLLLAAQKGREVFWDTPVGLEILWYTLATLSVFVFAYGVVKPIAKYRRGENYGWPPRNELAGRIGSAFKMVFAHSTIRRRDSFAGWAHRGIFYGWIVLFMGTVIVLLDHDITGPIFGFHFFKGNFYLFCKAFLNLFGTFLIIGLLAMMIRRAFIKPPKLDYARPDREPGDKQFDRGVYRVGDWVFVVALLIIALTGFVIEGTRIAMSAPGYYPYQFGGWVVAQIWYGLGVSDGTLGGIRHGIWWFHGIVAITFVAAIPYTKASHMLSSFAGLVLRDPKAKSRLQPIPEEKASEPAGYATLADFTERHLLQLDACTKCGRCHEACPANQTGRPLSPRDVILELREQSNAAMSGIGVGGVLGMLMHGEDSDPKKGSLPQVIGHDGVREETLWACYQCNACVEICPVGIEQAPIINQLRRHLVEEGELDSNLQATLQTINKSGNSFGENKRKRGRWAKELDFEIKDARKEPVDVLWFVGDYASFDPRSQTVTRTIATLLNEAGVDFGILYDGERNSGNDVRRVGEEGLFESLATQNIATLEDCEFNRILTSDPHTLNTLRNEYSQLTDQSWEVVHHTMFLLELVESGRLKIEQPLSYRVTYHDPCHLGRLNGEFDAPRQLLEKIGCTLIEMPRNRDNSFCCGAGGGKIWIPDTSGLERPSENRIHEALGLGELDFFVVTCPKDVTMYEDAIKTTNSSDKIELRELTELIEEAVAPVPAAATSA